MNGSLPGPRVSVTTPRSRSRTTSGCAITRLTPWETNSGRASGDEGYSLRMPPCRSRAHIPARPAPIGIRTSRSHAPRPNHARGDSRPSSSSRRMLPSAWSRPLARSMMRSSSRSVCSSAASSRSTSASVSICARRRCSRENRRAFSRATAAWLVSVARNSISSGVKAEPGGRPTSTAPSVRSRANGSARSARDPRAASRSRDSGRYRIAGSRRASRVHTGFCAATARPATPSPGSRRRRWTVSVGAGARVSNSRCAWSPSRYTATSFTSRPSRQRAVTISTICAGSRLATSRRAVSAKARMRAACRLTST